MRLGHPSAAKSLDVTSPPEADGFGDRQQRASVLRERIDDPRRDAPGSLPVHDLVGDQLAKLFGQHLFCEMAGMSWRSARKCLGDSASQ